MAVYRSGSRQTFGRNLLKTFVIASRASRNFSPELFVFPSIGKVAENLINCLSYPLPFVLLSNWTQNINLLLNPIIYSSSPSVGIRVDNVIREIWSQPEAVFLYGCVGGRQISSHREKLIYFRRPLEERTGKIAMDKWKYLLCERYFHDFYLLFFFISTLRDEFFLWSDMSCEEHRCRHAAADENKVFYYNVMTNKW